MGRCREFVSSVIGWWWLASAALGQEPIDYDRSIKPVLRERCYACHGALKQEAGLRLDTAALAIKGGDSGAAVDVANVEASRLLKRVTSHDEADRMPPEGEPLKPSQIEAIRKWIASGAKGPADEQPERDPRDHWAFKPPVRAAVPQVADAEWSRNPIDAFLAAELQKRGLTHQPAADKRVWLRRVSLDLIGLPPTVAELDAFVADQSPQAYDTVITRLLDSPHYGERWGRHWMDIWRYSDWWGLGAEVRNSQKHIWHWREWIIDSLNADKGYDQMLREMLAADELYPNDLDRLRASGFLARQYFKFNRTSWLDETIEHTSKAMLGLTFNCAKCHDHKYEPFAQTDYYRLRAIFEPYQIRTEMLPGETDFERDGLPRAFDCNLDAQSFLHVRGDDRNPDKSRLMEPAVPAFLSHADWKVEAVTLPPEAVQPGLRAFVLENHLKSAEQAIASARAALDAARKKLIEAEAAQKLAAEREANNPKPEPPADGKSLAIKDDFAVERPELWEQIGGKWSYANGRLVQSQDGSTRVALRLKSAPPENFEARLKFMTTGGQMWKSVGINFDVVEKSEKLAYLSAVAGGSKSQIAFKNGGDNNTYPNEASQARKIEVNRPYEMTLRVRGTLVNLLVDGELSIAYRLPVARNQGAIEIITFDATAEFLAFELKELATDVAMTESKSGIKPTEPPQNVDQAKLAVAIAEKTLAHAEAQPVSIRARAAAQQARYLQPTADNVASLAQQAVKAERSSAVIKAEEAALQAELELMRAPADKKADIEKKLATARAAIDTARKAVETPAENFTPLNGALKTLENNLENEESRRKPFPATSTGRRTAFAKWLTDPKHPLPARVAINHIWMRHMGRPLVPTVFDFGRKGTPPTHPELLDWLAVELIEHNWSMKHIHRLIVSSQAYRMTSSSAEGEANKTRDGEKGNAATTSSPGLAVSHSPSLTVSPSQQRDPDNLYYWRANPIRMEAQIVRDSLLYLAGELDLTRGGPSIPVSDENSKRRSLYFVHSHNEHQKFLSMFDDANVLDCYRRAESIVPQQALALENSPIATAMGQKIAQRLATAQPNSTDTEFIRAAFLTILSVEPTSDELAVTTQGLSQLTAIARQKNRPNPETYARTSLVQALLNHNDFVTIR